MYVTFPWPQELAFKEKRLEGATTKIQKKNIKVLRAQVKHLTEVRDQLNNEVRSPEIITYL